MLFGVYLLIRKRSVLRYIYRLLAVYVSLLANIRVLYHKTGLKSSEIRKNLRDSTLNQKGVIFRTIFVFTHDWCDSSHPTARKSVNIANKSGYCFKKTTIHFAHYVRSVAATRRLCGWLRDLFQ